MCKSNMYNNNTEYEDQIEQHYCKAIPSEKDRVFTLERHCKVQMYTVILRTSTKKVKYTWKSNTEIKWNNKLFNNHKRIRIQGKMEKKNWQDK